MRSALIKHSIKARVTLSALTFFFISICLLALISNRILRDGMQNKLGDQQLAMVSYMAADLDNELADRLRWLENVANKITPEMLADPSATQFFLADRPILKDIFNAGYYTLRSDGTATASYPVDPKRIGKSYLHRDHVVNALREGRSSVGKPHISSTAKLPEFGMAAPILDKQGAVIGAIVGLTDLSRPGFIDRIMNQRYGKSGGYKLVVPQHNLIVTATDKSLVMKPLSATGANPLIERFMQGFEDPGIFVDSQGEEVLSSARKIPSAGWLLIAKMPTSEAFAPIRDIQRQLIVTTIILTLLTAALIWWILHRQLLPLFSTMTALSACNASEQHPAPLVINRNDEIGQLIGSFNNLLETLGERERELRESENNHRLLFESADDAIFIHNENGNILVANPIACERLGYSEAELLTMTVSQIDSPEDALLLPERLERLIRDGKHTYETLHRQKDGSLISTEVGARRIIWKGQPAIMSICRDITGRKLAEEARHKQLQSLEQSRRLESLGVLAGGIAHDFNNILAIIIGYCSLTKMNVDNAVANVSKIEKAAQRAAELCNQMLSYAGKSLHARRMLNLAVITEDTVNLLKGSLPTNVTLRSELSQGIPNINADENQIRQIITNLIINSSEAIGDENGTVRITVATEDLLADEPITDYHGDKIPAGRYVCLEVTDNGCGMNEETKSRIFEPFYSTKFIGRGLGLSAALGVIRSHKGYLQIFTREGGGTSFKVFLSAEQ